MIKQSRFSSEDKTKAKTKTGLWQRLTEIGNYDFCPWANHYVYWLKQPIGWFVIAAACSLLVGLFLGPQGYVFFAAIVAVMVLGVVWPWIAMRGIQCELRFDRGRVTEGESATVILKVINRSVFPVWGLTVSRGMDRLNDVATTSTNSVSTFMGLRCVAPWSETEFEWQFQPRLRGEYPTVTPILGNGFPFGLWSCNRPIAVVGRLLVWPKTWALAALPNVVGNVQSLLGALAQTAGTEGEVLGLRPYRRGDSMKSIHWPQTARQGEMVVRERQSNRRREIQIIVDTTARHHLGTAGHSSLEWSFRIAGSLCQAFHTQGFQVECRLSNESILAPVQTSGIKPILDRMAKFELPLESSVAIVLTNSLPICVSSVDRSVFFVTTDRNQLAGANIDSPNKTTQPGWIVIDTQELAQLDSSQDWNLHLPSVFRVMTRKHAVQGPFVTFKSNPIMEGSYETQL